MYHRLVVIAAWLSLAFIAFVTVSPAGLRPQVAGAGFEHVAAFAVCGLLFGIAYPRHLFMVVALVFVSAIVLEAIQLVTPDRHGRLTDLLAKIAGGSAGIVIARLTSRPKVTRSGSRD